jgi:hypothetical protein
MVKEVIHEVNTTPKWEDLMPLYFEVLAKRPKEKGQQELLDLVKDECMRAARMMDRSVDVDSKEVLRLKEINAVKPKVPFRSVYRDPRSLDLVAEVPRGEY